MNSVAIVIALKYRIYSLCILTQDKHRKYVNVTCCGLFLARTFELGLLSALHPSVPVCPLLGLLHIIHSVYINSSDAGEYSSFWGQYHACS